MKRLGQIREDYDLVTEKVEAESNRLAMLVRAGLFDPKKLPMLKRALSKDVKDMTPAERKILIELLDSLMSEVLQSQQVYNKVKQNVMVKEVEESLYEATSNNKAFDGYLSKADPRFSKMPTERQIPTIIILKRKAIRIYPDNQKVALYYSQALDKYVTIPFGVMEGGSVNESVEDMKNKSDSLTKELPPSTENPTIKKPKQDVEKKKKELQTKKREDLYTRKLNTKFGVNRAIVAMRKDDSIDTPTRIGTSAGLQLRQKVTSMMAKRNKPSVAPVKNVSTVPALSESKGRIAKSKFYEKRNQQIDEAFPLLAVGAGIAARAIASRAAASGAGRAIASKAVDAGSKVASGAARVARNTATGAGRLARKVGSGAAGAAGALVGLAGSGDKEPAERTFSEPKELSPKALDKNTPKSQQIRTAVKPKENKLKNSGNVMESLYSMGSNEEKRLVIADESILINTITAKKIIGVYESLNRDNREKVNSLLNESVSSFKKFANFAAKQ